MSTKHDLNEKFSWFLIGICVLVGLFTQSISAAAVTMIVLATICVALRILR